MVDPDRDSRCHQRIVSPLPSRRNPGRRFGQESRCRRAARLPAVPASIIRTVQFGPAEPFFPSLCCIYRGDEQSRSEGLLYALGKKRWNMIHTTNKPIAKLHRAPQPPLSHPGATPDSDRARKPPLAEPPATDQELNPGDRVEGLGDFGRPTGEFGTVEQANEDDAVVKWDDDGRTRLHQPSLKKV